VPRASPLRPAAPVAEIPWPLASDPLNLSRLQLTSLSDHGVARWQTVGHLLLATTPPAPGKTGRRALIALTGVNNNYSHAAAQNG